MSVGGRRRIALKRMRMEGTATSGCSMTLVSRMRCVGGVGRFLDGSTEVKAIGCGGEGCSVLAVRWEGLDRTAFRSETIYDDADKLQSDLSDMLRYEDMVIKCVEALPFGCKPVVVHTDRRIGRGDCTGANEADAVQREYSSWFTSPCVHNTSQRYFLLVERD